MGHWEECFRECGLTLRGMSPATGGGAKTIVIRFDIEEKEVNKIPPQVEEFAHRSKNLIKMNSLVVEIVNRYGRSQWKTLYSKRYFTWRLFM